MEGNEGKKMGRILRDENPLVWMAKREGEGFGGINSLNFLTSKSLHKRKDLEGK